MLNVTRSRLPRNSYLDSTSGISESEFWHAIKADYNVDSRSEIDEVGYVRLAARLQTAETHRHMFESLCREIKAKKDRCTNPLDSKLDWSIR